VLIPGKTGRPSTAAGAGAARRGTEGRERVGE